MAKIKYYLKNKRKKKKTSFRSLKTSKYGYWLTHYLKYVIIHARKKNTESQKLLRL